MDWAYNSIASFAPNLNEIILHFILLFVLMFHHSGVLPCIWSRN